MKDNSTCESCGATAPILFLSSHMGLCSSCDAEYISDQEDRWERENYWRSVVTARELIEQGLFLVFISSLISLLLSGKGIEWDEDIIKCK
jgi:hypothetical protein